MSVTCPSSGNGEDGDQRGVAVIVSVLLFQRGHIELKTGSVLAILAAEYHVKGGGALILQPPGVGGQQQHQHHRQHQAYQQQIDENKAPSQPPDHVTGTSR